MINQFILYLEKHIPFTDNERYFIEQLLPIQHFLKDTFILIEGTTSKAFYFNLKGCVRLFYNVDGKEKSAFFYTENQFISSYESFVKQKPARHSLQTIEDTSLVVISQENAYRLLEFSPKFEALARIIMEEELMIYQDIIASFITQNPEQRYLSFLEQYPELLQRIPQIHIASYLGVSPESLSRIKNRLAQKRRKS